MDMKKKLNGNKKYDFPSDISLVYHKGKILVIAVKTANWLVLENDSQLDFFNLLKDYTIEESFEQFKGDYSDAIEVITQIEARQFHSHEVMTNDSRGLHLYLTNECNMRCPHCYMSAGRKKTTQELTYDEINKILTHYKSTGGNLVTFSGGEVTMRSDFVSILRLARNLDLYVEVLTNGTQWSDELISSCSEYIDRIQVSIDGYSEETNSLVRGKGSFIKAMKTVDSFANLGIYTTIGVTPLLSNDLFDNYKEYIKFGKALCEKYKGKNFEIKFTAELWDGRDIKVSEQENSKYRDVINKINEGIFGELYYDIAFVAFHKKKGIENNCSFGNYNIDSNGDAYLCPVITQMKPIGNIRHDSLDILEQKRLTSRSKSDVVNLEPCNSCELMYICGGGCRVKYFKPLTEGDLSRMSKSPYRNCNQSYKSSIYDQMIRTHEYLFVE